MCLRTVALHAEKQRVAHDFQLISFFLLPLFRWTYDTGSFVIQKKRKIEREL